MVIEYDKKRGDDADNGENRVFADWCWLCNVSATEFSIIIGSIAECYIGST